MKVLVGLSGGVDSAAAASYLLEQGYEVGGAYMHLYDGSRKFADGRDARAVAEKLGIPFHVLDMRDIFRTRVLSYFAEGYLAGRTPNPCILCNQALKFGAFSDSAHALGYDMIATGHYAKIRRQSDGLYYLMRSGNLQKDQSYFLYHLTQDQLAHAISPLEDPSKEEIRARARSLGLDVSEKKDSQDICFVEQGKYIDFIEQFTAKPLISGDFEDVNGNYLGRHDGIARYTIGQRKGVRTAFGKPMYVVSKDAKTHRVVMGEDADLYRDCLLAKDAVIHPAYRDKIAQGGFSCSARHRYRQKETAVTLSLASSPSCVGVSFESPQRAVTPGQFVVFYDGDTVIGGGEII